MNSVLLNLRLLVMRLILLGFSTLIVSCASHQEDYNNSIEVFQQFSDLQSVINQEKDRLMIVNFWATSCPPCLREMPHFGKLEEEYGSKLKVLLVSLDKVDLLESRVYPFVEKYKITPEVAVLQDPNYSAWTDEIDSSWYGALPATIMIKGKERNFRFGSYESYEELQADVDSFME